MTIKRCGLFFAVGWCLLVLGGGAAGGLLTKEGSRALRKAQPPVTGTKRSLSPKTVADRSRPADKWVRVERDRNGKPIALQTAIVRYTATTGDRPRTTVDLIGAVHVADGRYYDALNARFQQYDALLYELVAPPGTIVPRGVGASNGHPVGALQNSIKRVLKLEHQLSHIDYTRKNFVHADMGPEALRRSMAGRDESLGQMFFRLLGRSMAQQSKARAGAGAFETGLLAAWFAKDRSLRLKTILANQFDQMGSLLTGLGGPNGSSLIEGRNAVAMRVLDRQLKAGKKKLGIFYGVGHLPDMDRRLRRDFGLRPTEMLWLTAWDLRARPDQAARRPTR